VLAALVEAGGQTQDFLLLPYLNGHGSLKTGFPFRQRARLVDDQRIHLTQALDGRRVAEQDALGGRLAGRHHDGHRRGEAQGAGTGDDQHRDTVDQAEDPAPLPAKQAPGEEAQQAISTTPTTK
jgi:hypothetical protein